MAAFAFPGVEPDMMVIAAGRNERRAVAHPLHHLEAEHAAVEPQRPIEIGDLEMHMPDPRTGDDRWVFGHVLSCATIALRRSMQRPFLTQGRTLRPRAA